jgi:LemA protein
MGAGGNDPATALRSDPEYCGNRERLCDPGANGARGSGSPSQQKAATALEGSLIKVVALSEQYPNLASNEQFLQLQYQLEGTENRIAVARTRYNDVLRYYNSLTQQFPASLFGFSLDENFFEAETAAGKAPQVKF